jgi:DNA-binding NarL/FixJ family response regulator
MIIDISDKITTNMNSAYHQLAQWMPALQRILKLPPNAFEGEQTESRGGPHRAAHYGLTRRETDVLRLLAKGHANTEIASRLEISPHTVKSHVIHIFNKLGVNDRIQAAVMAVQQRLIE